MTISKSDKPGKSPAMLFYVNDWLSSSRVALMSLEQQGAYMRLLCHCWASGEASLPDDEEALAMLSGMGERWFNGGSTVVRDCFVPHPTIPGKITNERLLALHAERVNWVNKSIEGGLKSAAARRSGMKGGSTTAPTTTPTNGQPKGNSSSSSSSSSSSNTNTRKPPLSPLGEMVEAVQVDFPPGMGTLEAIAALEEWLAYKRVRKEGYRRVTYVQKLVEGFYKKHGAEASKAFVEAVNHSIAQNWKGCFSPREELRAARGKVCTEI